MDHEFEGNHFVVCSQALLYFRLLGGLFRKGGHDKDAVHCGRGGVDALVNYSHSCNHLRLDSEELKYSHYLQFEMSLIEYGIHQAHFIV